MIILRDVHFLVLLPQGFVLRPIDEAVFIKALYLLKIFLPAGMVGAGDGLLSLVGMPEGARSLPCFHDRGLGEGAVKLDIGGWGKGR